MGRAVTLCALLAAGACMRVPVATKIETAELRVIAEPEEASVYIDGHYFGRARVLAEVPKALKPGKHLLTVSADGYFPHDSAITLLPGISTLEIKLDPVPP